LVRGLSLVPLPPASIKAFIMLYWKLIYPYYIAANKPGIASADNYDIHEVPTSLFIMKTSGLGHLPLPSHSFLVIPARFRIRPKRSMLISLRWGFGMVKTLFPLTI